MQPTHESTTPLLTNIVEKAIELAAQWHDGTYRKSVWRPPAFSRPDDIPVRTPVMVHLTAAAFSVQQAGWGPNTIAATYLHDILEDPNRHGEYFSQEQLQTTMGERITRLVLQLTEEKFDAAGRPNSWKVRKDAYLAGIPTFDPEAVAICLADKHHNLWSMNQSLKNGVDVFQSTRSRRKLSSGPEEQLWFFTSVLENSAPFSDERLVPLRAQLTREIDTFREYFR